MQKEAAVARIQVRSQTIHDDLLEALVRVNKALDVAPLHEAATRGELIRAQVRLENALVDCQLLIKASHDV